MMISTRGRYALRVMIDLAEHQDEGYIPMKDVAKRQGVSLGYMEKILPVLVKNGIVEGLQGKTGGYRLIRKPEGYTLGEILRLTEGSLAPVACLECGASPCEKAADCRTLPVWTELDRRINEYLDGVTIADLLRSGPKVSVSQTR
ncbi:MAG: RrF2 family transcriptional regulator [Oscillospiraceae bacterium]|nr:RrF2 family transcriptional regulator [Oscillospiraceae bacterium]